MSNPIMQDNAILQDNQVQEIIGQICEVLQGHPGERAKVRDLADSHRKLDVSYRKALWLSHGCPIVGLYGDDGEMQCSNMKRHVCLDFKRHPIERLEEELGKMKLTESGIIIKGLNDDRIGTDTHAMETHELVTLKLPEVEKH